MDTMHEIDPGIVVRKMQFEIPDDISAHWNATKPEWSHIVNGASLTMPYLEPYLIRVVNKAIASITDSQLREEARAYVAQEGQHYRQHRKFNDLLLAQGYDDLRIIEERMAGEYARWESSHSQKWNLAYAAGFETAALGISLWLVNDREYLFGGADSAIASLILWHFVEELEHKEVALGVYNHVCGGYFYRIFGSLFAMTHLLKRTHDAYKLMLKKDGLWRSVQSRWRLQKMILRAHRALIPHMVRCCIPGHDPSKVDDPQWIRDWIARHARGDEGLVRLDTSKMAEALL